MSEIEQNPADAATRWLILLQADDVTAQDRQQFTEWLAADPRHPLAYRHAQRFWTKLDHVPEIDARALDDRLSPLAAGAPGTTYKASREDIRRFVPWRQVTGLAVAAAIAALCFIGIAQTWHLGATYRTDTGEQRTVALSDGSTVHLNTATALSVAMASGARRLILHEGEAFFSVAPDSKRPFEVTAGNGTIRALGTAFNVRTDGKQVIVTVTEHSVRVSGPAQAVAEVPEGHQLTYGVAGKVGPIEAIDPERALAWRRHRLIFENQPLAEVIAELNRYRHGWIVLRDPSLQKLPITAVFDVHKTDQALRTIEETLPVLTFTVTDRLVWLSRSSAR